MLRWRRALRGMGGLGLLAGLAGGFTPLAGELSAWLGGSPSLERADAIVVLGRGGSDAETGLTASSLRRTLRGLDLYQAGLAPVMAFSGSDDETQARARLARGLGVPAGAILVIDLARTTREEAARAAETLSGLRIRRVLLVTDPVDVPRSTALFARAGFEVLPAPTLPTDPSGPESRLRLLRDIAIEAMAWGYYRLAGYL